MPGHESGVHAVLGRGMGRARRAMHLHWCSVEVCVSMDRWLSKQHTRKSSKGNYE